MSDEPELFRVRYVSGWDSYGRITSFGLEEEPAIFDSREKFEHALTKMLLEEAQCRHPEIDEPPGLPSEPLRSWTRAEATESRGWLNAFFRRRYSRGFEPVTTSVLEAQQLVDGSWVPLEAVLTIPSLKWWRPMETAQ